MFFLTYPLMDIYTHTHTPDEIYSGQIARNRAFEEDWCRGQSSDEAGVSATQATFRIPDANLHGEVSVQ